jgi:hypothetical protein
MVIVLLKYGFKKISLLHMIALICASLPGVVLASGGDASQFGSIG